MFACDLARRFVYCSRINGVYSTTFVQRDATLTRQMCEKRRKKKKKGGRGLVQKFCFVGNFCILPFPLRDNTYMPYTR